jgi:hypothetical protein
MLPNVMNSLNERFRINYCHWLDAGRGPVLAVAVTGDVATPGSPPPGTYDVLAGRLRRPVGSCPVRLASISVRGLGLVATQTFMFLFADIEGSAPLAQRLGEAYAGVGASDHRLIRAGLAPHDS